MKIQLDTTKKTIKIDEDVKLTKLMATIKKLLPHGEWMDFTLQTNTTIEKWVQPYRWYWNDPIYPWYNTPTYYCGGAGLGTINSQTTFSTTLTAASNNSLSTLNSGIYNIEVK